MNVHRMWQDSRRRRQLLVGSYGFLVLIVLVAVAAQVVTVLSASRPDLADRLAEAGDWLAGGTLGLAVIAGLVALQAFAAATGLPHIELQLKSRGSSPNVARFQLFAVDEDHPAEMGASFHSLKWGQRTFEERFYTEWGTRGNHRSLANHFDIFVRNVSAYSARNPALLVRLNGIVAVGQDFRLDEGWRSIGTDTGLIGTWGSQAFQWDGGSIYSIHGHSARSFRLDLKTVLHESDTVEPSITLEFLAEGYRKAVDVPVSMRVNGESVFPNQEYRIMPDWL